ncbi:MAG: MBL fold metallo-hydrolase [Chitinivibrionales bacterium]|nr:MBL fold metallo-hydrolase [Chitinivibrionales bacterium]MBD3394495.1 MBL fold metallo-hydrolase [Chitinivibrionales bacterium]
MKLAFMGGARTVTGSQVIVSVNGSKVLLECGLYQGRRQESYDRNKHFSFVPGEIDQLVLTHAHMDHSGNIPSLVKKGFAGSIYATPPTVDLCKMMLRDSAYLQERDIEWVNKIRRRKGEAPFKPLYTMQDAEDAMDQFVGIPLDKTFTVAPGINATFRDAGHILGAASILLEIEEKGRSQRWGFTGDVGRRNVPIMHDPNLLRDLDILVMESTYGDRTHSADADAEEQLAQLVNETAALGGKIIIPSFAVGRTQLIVYLFHKLFNENRIRDLPIFVDSPMACHATEIFRTYMDQFDRETQRVFLHDNTDPFGFARLKYVEDVEESKKLNRLAYPHIIISASGMAEGGRVLHHLKNNIENHRNLVLFVGYAAKETLARKMMDGDKKVRIFGEEYRVKCRVEKMDAFSAHADRPALLDYVNINPTKRLKHIFLMHGEIDQALSLRNALRSQGYENVHVPEPGEVFTV